MNGMKSSLRERHEMKGREDRLLANRIVILIGVFLLPMLTFGICVSDLPVCEYADSEVATNLS